MTVRIHLGDCRQLLRALPADSVHCVVTSPPYWGLRDYGVEGQLGLEETPQDSRSPFPPGPATPIPGPQGFFAPCFAACARGRGRSHSSFFSAEMARQLCISPFPNQTHH